MYPPTILEFAFNIFLEIKIKLSGCNSLFQRAFFFKIDAVCLQSPVAACAGLIRMKLIIFIAAAVVLCFRFVTKATLITKQYR